MQIIQNVEKFLEKIRQKYSYRNKTSGFGDNNIFELCTSNKIICMFIVILVNKVLYT